MTVSPPRCTELPLPRPRTREWFRASLRWPDRRPCSEWAEGTVVLDESVSAMPGPLSLDVSPYMREILDAFSDESVRRIVLNTSTQIGKSLSIKLMMGYAIDCDPGPMMMVLPTEDATREFSDEHVKSMLTRTACLRRHLRPGRWAATRYRFRLDRMDLHLAWAGSPMRLASKAKRYLFFDEVNKFPMFSGVEADPIELARERLRTYRHTAKEVVASTPTTSNGYITAAYRDTDQRTYHVPCPHCGTYQRLLWERLHYAKDGSTPEEIRANKFAWYVCAQCEERIDEADKAVMVRRGVWCPMGCTVGKDGCVTGRIPLTTSRGYTINALYSLWITWADMAAKWLEDKSDRAKLMNFVNSWLAEEWEDVSDRISGEIACSHGRMGDIPRETVLLAGAIDVQKDHLWYVLFAFLEGGEHVQLVECGRIDSTDNETDFDVVYGMLVEGAWKHPESGDMQAFWAVDAAFRSDEVYHFAARNPGQIIPMRGSTHRVMLPVSYQTLDKVPAARRIGAAHRRGMRVYTSDTVYFWDMVARYMREGNLWLPEDTPSAYIDHLTSMHKVTETDTRGVVKREIWQLKAGRYENHMGDCTYMSFCLAYVRGYFSGAVVRKTTPRYSKKSDSVWKIGR